MMMDGGQLAGIIAILCVFGIPLSAIWTSHKRKMLELQLKMRYEGDLETQNVIRTMREEMRSLRETTMQYDISFDTVLQRVERRVAALENLVHGASSSPTVQLQPLQEADIKPTIELRPQQAISQEDDTKAAIELRPQQAIRQEVDTEPANELRSRQTVSQEDDTKSAIEPRGAR